MRDVAGCTPAFRGTWRSSRREAGALVLLGMAGGLGGGVADLPQAWAATIAIGAVTSGGVLAARALRRPVRMLVISDDATLDGVPLLAMRVDWRGPLAFLQARDGVRRTHRLVWWPDTLSPAERRALRLAIDRWRD